MDKRYKIAFFTGLLVVAGYFFGTVCKRIDRSFELILYPSKELLVLLLWYLLALGAILICAGLVATLLRPVRVGFFAFALSGLAMILGWGISLFSAVLILVYLVTAYLYLGGVAKELNERIKFSVRAISEAHGLLIIGLILLVSGSLYRGLDVYFEREGLTLPEAYIELFMQPLQKRIEEQVPAEERQRAVAEFREEFQKSIDEFMENTLQPYERYIPAVVTAGTFMSLLSATHLLTWIPNIILSLIFILLKSLGVTTIMHEQQEVQRLVIS